MEGRRGREAQSTSSSSSMIKLMCSYGGRILPRYPDGKLRYVGGHTRVVAVHPSIPFSELLPKLQVLCGRRVSVKCQLPTEDLDALISVKSEEDLAHLIQEYHAPRLGLTPINITTKIRAFLFDPISCRQQQLLQQKQQQRTSPPSSSSSSSPTSSRFSMPPVATHMQACIHHSPRNVCGYAYHHYANPTTNAAHSQ